MNKSDSLKKTEKVAVTMSDNFLWIFFGGLLVIDLVVGAIMMINGKSFGNAASHVVIITIVVPAVLGTAYGMFVSPSRDDNI